MNFYQNLVSISMDDKTEGNSKGSIGHRINTKAKAEGDLGKVKNDGRTHVRVT